MRLIQFYRNEIPTDDGDFLDDILTWGPEQLEGCHSFVQWMFPMKEGSMFHPEVPRLTDDEIAIFRTDETLQYMIHKCFMKMLNFYCMEIVLENPPVIAVNARDPWWLRKFNHNFLRITRLLKSLRYLGLESHSRALFKVLARLRGYHHSITDNTFGFWEEAANSSLP